MVATAAEISASSIPFTLWKMVGKRYTGKEKRGKICGVECDVELGMA